MTNWKKFLTNTTIRYIDHSKSDNRQPPMASFAIDDALAIAVGNNQSPSTIRSWVHDQTIMLGIPDAKLPYIEEAIEYIQQQGYHAVIRNSGGLAVVLDEGVLNISLILPDAKHIGIHEGYEIMVSFIQYLFEDVTSDIRAFEVEGSYCPGDYDLSIDGKKFAGISQRRVKNGSAVQIYLCIEGDGIERAAMMKEFYQIGLRGEKGKFDYPSIEPETMASLSQLLNKTITVEEVTEQIQHALKRLNNTISYQALTEEELDNFEKRMEQMVDRNKKVFGD